MTKKLKYTSLSTPKKENKKSYLTIEHISGAGGETVPSMTLLTYHIEDKIIKILIDSGGGQQENQRTKDYPTGIDILILTHAHVDHCADLPEIWIRNPGIQIFVPERNKWLVSHAVQDAARFKPTGNALKEIEEFRGRVNNLVGKLEGQINKIEKGIVRPRDVMMSRKDTGEEILILYASIIEDIGGKEPKMLLNKINHKCINQLQKKVLQLTYKQNRRNNILKKILSLRELLNNNPRLC